MKLIFDPITNVLTKYVWCLWAVLWISLAFGVGQEEFNITSNISYDTTIASTISAILLCFCVLLQTIRQVYYSHLGHPLVKLGRWVILGATSIFAFRMVYMLVMYGGAPSSLATLIGADLLAIGISLNSIGMMQQSYFEEHKHDVRSFSKWNNSWRNMV